MIESKSLNELNRKLAKTGEEIFKIIDSIPQGIKKKLAIGANDIRNTIITEMMTGPKTGKLYKKKSVTHQASAPGQSPAVDSGELISRIIFDVRDMELEVGAEAGAPYAEFLELGTKKMKARPWLDPAVEKHASGIFDDVGDVVVETMTAAFDKGKRS